MCKLIETRRLHILAMVKEDERIRIQNEVREMFDTKYLDTRICQSTIRAEMKFIGKRVS